MSNPVIPKSVVQWKAEAAQRKQEQMEMLQKQADAAPQNGKEPAFEEA